jgi:nucleotide-binding universal stress UspA family protein
MELSNSMKALESISQKGGTDLDSLDISELREGLIERILVPVDGSQDSNYALEFAIDLAKKYSAEICLLHVISVMPIYSLSSWEPFPLPFHIIESEDEGEEILASASDKVREAGIRSIAWLDYGHTASIIVKTAKKKSVDLIVFANEKRGLIAKLFLGSVCDEVIHNAPCPVLSVAS